MWQKSFCYNSGPDLPTLLLSALFGKSQAPWSEQRPAFARGTFRFYGSVPISDGQLSDSGSPSIQGLSAMTMPLLIGKL
jgi:hypothetical protein